MISRIAVIAAVVVLFSACTSTPQFQSGPDAEVTHDGLTRVDKTVMDTVWARTDIDLTDYSKLMFEGVGVEYRPVKGAYSGRGGANTMRRLSQTEFQLDANTKALVEEEIMGAFIEELQRSKSFDVVEEPGPDVLTLRAELLDVISRVPPEPVGRSVVFIDSVGEATVVLELRDSMSDAIIVRAVDRRAAERPGGQMSESTPVTNRAEVRRLGRKWATIVRTGIEKLMTEE